MTVLHPWLPQYRIEFFERAVATLKDAGVDLTVAYGSPPPDARGRRDEATASWAVPLPTRTFELGDRALLHHRLLGVTRGRDLVIAEHAIRNAETYPMLWRQGPTRPRVALWGHGRTYTKNTSGLEARLKDRLARRAHWFFAYTDGGAAHVANLGVDPDRITVVQNSMDTEKLTKARGSITASHIRELQKSMRLTPGRTALYIGALDHSKRLDVLCAAAAEAARRLPGFSLVIAGAGPMEDWVRHQTASAPWLRYVGPVFGDAKAELAAVSDVMLVTGRVGLVAVDSFALRLPIVTCEWSLHAPEFEYLMDGANSSLVSDSSDALGIGVTQLLENPITLERLRAGCARSAEIYTVEEMVRRFCTGVVSAVNAPRLGPLRHREIASKPLLEDVRQ